MAELEPVDLKTECRRFERGDFVYIRSTNSIAEVLDVFEARGTQDVRTDADGMRDAEDLEHLATKHFRPGVNFYIGTLKAMGYQIKFSANRPVGVEGNG